MDLDALDDTVSMSVPEAIGEEPSGTIDPLEADTMLDNDPTTIFDREEPRSDRRAGSSPARSVPLQLAASARVSYSRVSPVPPRRRAVTPAFGLDASCVAAVRALL